MRVLNSIKVKRPSTAKLIDLRLDTRISYTESQIKVYRTKHNIQIYYFCI